MWRPLTTRAKPRRTVAPVRGVLAAVFHFANGLWSLGITWGLWTSPAAMRRANAVSVVVGVLLAVAGLGGLGGMRRVDIEQARATENWMEEQREQRVPPASGSEVIHPTAATPKGE